MFPGVLQVEFPLLVPELRVGERVEVPVAQPGEYLSGVVARGKYVGVAAAFIPGDVVTPPDDLCPQTPHTMGPSRAHCQALQISIRLVTCQSERERETS